MIKRVIIEILSDACKSHKPIEALRIAAGLVVSQLPVRLIIRPNARSIIEAPAEDLVDGKYREQFLAVLENHGVSLRTDETNIASTPDLLYLKF